MKLWFGWVLVFSVLYIEPVYAASFDCDKQQTLTEKTICQHINLNDADVKMATTYNILRRLVPMGTRSVIQDEQIKWLQLRDRCRDSLECLEQVYSMRLQKLGLHLDRIYRNGPY
ncbi:hypothetical protein A3K93_00875 [Acinetobacter sp. NCu2D-2]|uniref:lysozyme inhibitor LprI family protein n=1 Tax=Acinetobacter sp. NCu2D-2 TaxID=1608473 RepID=UPI0007CDEADE|nr:lysozyme inhibitor LprI family protein [Acinetobacter sp. NCu2D-2]ANF80879.1 hypothetical protein A3K93_00875 [Acinetobacter sp. NCu2D-2]